MSKEGILYVATGARYADEAAQSIKSVRKFSNLPITVFTSHPERIPNIPGIVIHLVPPDQGVKVKPMYIPESPYGKTLFLDTDTIVVKTSAFEPFKILDRFDFAMTHAPARSYERIANAPNCFPSFNSGVIFFNNDRQVVRNVLIRWRRRYIASGPLSDDQSVLSTVLYHSRASSYVLPPEWNCRGKASGVLHPGQIAVLHHRNATRMFADNVSHLERFFVAE